MLIWFIWSFKTNKREDGHIQTYFTYKNHLNSQKIFLLIINQHGDFVITCVSLDFKDFDFSPQVAHHWPPWLWSGLNKSSNL